VRDAWLHLRRRDAHHARGRLSGTAGGNGYTVERWHHDAKIFTIFEGTSEIQRMIYARRIGRRA
jgi:alkylation response protein AidB-like acyl-CoA dehydrogenase